MTQEQIDIVRWLSDEGYKATSQRQFGASDWREYVVPALRALLAEWEEAKRERDAFVAVLDPDGKNVVSAMVAAQERGREIERLKAVEATLLQTCDNLDGQRNRAVERAEQAEARLERVVETAKWSALVSYTPVDGEAIHVVPVSVVLAAAEEP